MCIEVVLVLVLGLWLEAGRGVRALEPGAKAKLSIIAIASSPPTSSASVFETNNSIRKKGLFP